MIELAASAALSIYGAAMTAKAQAEQATADNIAQAEKRRLEFNRDQQSYFQNLTAAAKQNTADNFNIGIAAAQAHDNLALAKAGSGLSGASINELDDEVSRNVSADLVSVNRSYIDSQDKLNQERISKNDNRLFQANQSRSVDYTKGIQSAIIGGAAPFAGKALGGVFEQKTTNQKAKEDGFTKSPSQYQPKGSWYENSNFGKDAFIPGKF